MAAKKEVKGVVKLVVPAKQANPAPPIGPALGAQGTGYADSVHHHRLYGSQF